MSPGSGDLHTDVQRALLGYCRTCHYSEVSYFVATYELKQLGMILGPLMNAVANRLRLRVWKMHIRRM